MISAAGRYFSAMRRFLLDCRQVLTMNVVIAAAGIASGVVLARSLGPSARGAYAAFTVWPYAVAVLADAGLAQALAYHTANMTEARGQLCTFALTFALVAGSLIALIAGLLHPVAQLDSDLRNASYLALAATPFLLISGFCAHILVGAGYPVAFNSVRLCAALTYSAGIVALSVCKLASVWTFVVIFVAAQILAASLGAWLVWHRLRPRLTLPGIRLCASVLHYGCRSYGSAIAAQVNLRFDQLLMTMLLPAADLGYYVIAVAASGVLTPIFNAVATLTMSAVLSAGKTPRPVSYVLREIVKTVGVAGPVALCGILSAPALLPLIFGSNFSAAVASTQILLVAATFQGINSVLGNALRALGAPGRPAACEFMGAILTVVLLLSFLTRYGINAAAVISLIAYSSVTAAELLMLRQISHRPSFRVPSKIQPVTVASI